MSEQESVWYYSQHGERKGPVTLDILKGAITHMKVDREKDLVWGPGLPNWVKVSEVPELQGILSGPPAEVASSAGIKTPPVEETKNVATKPSTPAKPEASANPYKAPTAVDDEDSALADAMAARHMSGGGAPGIGRLKYFFYPFLASLVLGVIGGVVSGMLAESAPSLAAGVMVGIYVISIFMSFYYILARLRNLGMSWTNIFWVFVPFMNFWLCWRLSACPAGYHDHRKLDTPGWIMTVLYSLSLLLGIASIAYVLLTGASYYKDAADETKRKIELQRSERLGN